MIYDDIKVADSLSSNDICKQLEKKSSDVYGCNTPNIQAYETVAESVTTFLTTKEAIITGARGGERKTIHDCLVRELENQYALHKMMQACQLAEVSFQEYYSESEIDLNVENRVNAALFALGYKTAEDLKDVNIPEEVVDAMKKRLSSPEYKREATAFLDVDRPIFKCLQKMRSVISVLEPKQPTNGWPFGHSCVIL